MSAAPRSVRPGDPGFEQRLSPHDRALVGERVERLDRKALHAGVDVNMRQRWRGHAVDRRELMKQPVPARVEAHLLAEMAEDLRLDSLDLEARLINETRAGVESRGAF